MPRKPLEALPDPVVPATAGGPLPGIGSVSATGEYQYRIPIEVPAGRASVQPALALVHGSRTGKGHLGVGWQLEGLSEINRCARTFATEGDAEAISWPLQEEHAPPQEHAVSRVQHGSGGGRPRFLGTSGGHEIMTQRESQNVTVE